MLLLHLFYKKMKQTIKFFVVYALFWAFAYTLHAETDDPILNPSATFITSDGKEETTTTMIGSAPIVGTFYANPQDADDWECKYEWRFTYEGEHEPYLIRYEEETEVTFVDARPVRAVCYATFTKGGRTVVIDNDWYEEMGIQPITVSVSTSKLEMPNAFSPNGDEFNEFYRPKQSTLQSIVEFRAIIFNRNGQKLYEWTDPYADGWDGTYNGRPVKEGVYYCLVTAKGSDGVRYHFKKDVNLLRGFRETGRESSE